MAQIQSHGPLGRRVVEAIVQHRRGQVVDLRAFAAQKQAVAELQAALGREEQYQTLAPAHALYAFVHSHATAFCELMGALPALAPLYEQIERAEQEYMPGGPPMSPLTGSYFGMWSLFDANIGPRRETLGTCLLDLGAAFRLDPEFLRLLRVMQDSRMGLFVHERVDGGTQVLRELVTGEVGRYLVPAGYVGRPGEVWFARALPPPSARFDHGVVITTPYVMRVQREPEWTAFLQRTLPKVQATDERAAYASLMKWGLASNYWHEYVLEAYAGFETEVVYLTGLPDLAGSRPHGRDFAPEKFAGAIAAAMRGEVERPQQEAAAPRTRAVRAAAPREKRGPAEAPEGARPHTGEERHRLLLNSSRVARFTSCPLCHQPTKQRKFPLAIHVEPGGLVALGLTCRFCLNDDLVIVHQDVLEAELEGVFAERLPAEVGRQYLVLGTFDRAVWRRGLSSAPSMEQALPGLHPFREALTCKPVP